MALITRDDVETRLLGKVRFTDDVNDENQFPRKLLDRLIKEGIGNVERDLSPRYAAPFRSCRTQKFDDLPNTTKETLRTLCELRAVVLVLSSDFGRGTINNGDAYRTSQQDLYDKIIGRELKQRVNDAVGQWKYPPLNELELCPQNAQDDGYHGSVIVTSGMDGESDFPGKQITDPSEDFYNGVIDP